MKNKSRNELVKIEKWKTKSKNQTVRDTQILQILNQFLQMFVSLYHLTVLIEKNLASFHSNIKAKNIQLVLKKIGRNFGVQLNLNPMEIIENLDIVMKIALKNAESKNFWRSWENNSNYFLYHLKKTWSKRWRLVWRR